MAGLIAPDLLKELGCDVIPLYCSLDGNFPNHLPDPGVDSGGQLARWSAACGIPGCWSG